MTRDITRTLGAVAVAGVLALPVIVLGAGPQAAGPQSTLSTQRTSGAEVFRTYCASCHGVNARGDGPLASSMRRKPADLAEIAKRNGGEFPTDIVFRAIDGRQAVRGHGSPDMPVWGDAFSKSGDGGKEGDVKQRIDDLVEYLRSLQIKSTQ